MSSELTTRDRLLSRVNRIITRASYSAGSSQTPAGDISPYAYIGSFPGSFDGWALIGGGIKKSSRSFPPLPITTMNDARGRKESKAAKFKAKYKEERMSALRLMVPIFMLIQFFVVLLALVSAMLFADPQAALPTCKPSRRESVRPSTGRRA
jgi:hypothetical protein